MQIFKKVLIVFLLLVVLAILGGWMYVNSLKPQYSGTVNLEGIEKETTVYFDDYGIPHIYAENQADALTALGYVHAQDRLWQMELMRRIAPGRLSEIFGKELIENDKLFISLGIEEASQKSIEKLDKNSEAYLMTAAYLRGINQFIEHGATPIEFSLIGIEKEPFEIKDVYNIIGYMAFSFAMGQKTDPLLSNIKQKLGASYLKDLDVKISPETTLIKTKNQDAELLEQLTTSINQAFEIVPIPAFEGSNSWVLSPKKTATGNVLFANDPHIGFSQPGTWYEAHIVTPGYEMYGYHLAGVPFPLLGHNRHYAYGLTMFQNDDLNFYQEENHPTDSNQYKTPDGYATYKMTTKTIKVKDADDVTFELRTSRHGPVLNDALNTIDTDNPIAIWWAYMQFDGELIGALYNMSRATTMAEVKSAVSQIHAPGLNVMYGDAKGNVAWWAAGKLFKHRPDVSTKLVLNGSSSYDDPVEILDFSQNPMAENPSWKYVYSANNQPDTIAEVLYPGYYLPEDRAKRIVSLIDPKDDWTRADFEKMLNDVTSAVAPDVVSEFTKLVEANSFSGNEITALEILQKWDGSNYTDQVAPTIYNKWVYTYLKNTFKDELGEKLFEQLMNTHLMKRQIAVQIKTDSSVWWDNVKTDNVVETRKDILSNSFKESIAALEDQLGSEVSDWQWGKVHTLEHEHPLGTIEALRDFFNVGPFSVKGAREVIDNRGFNYDDSGLYKVTAGPSTRRIIDFSDVENSLSVLPTGQSGNPFSEHYSDQAALFNAGKFRKMKMNKQEIIQSSTKLTINPTNEKANNN